MSRDVVRAIISTSVSLAVGACMLYASWLGMHILYEDIPKVMASWYVCGYIFGSFVVLKNEWEALKSNRLPAEQKGTTYDT